jgi:probable HAF family extracellular repeat protein
MLVVAACSDLSGPGNSMPTVEITTPKTGTAIIGDSVELTGIAHDDRLISRVTIQVATGAEVEIPISIDRSVAFTTFVHDLPLGEFSLTARAYDEDGHSGSHTVTLSATDSNAPTLSILTPTEDELASRDSVVVAGTASDDRAVVSVDYSLDGAPMTTVTVEQTKATSFSFALHPAPGEHALLLRVRDAAGNATDQTVHFTTAAVKLAITSPSRDTTVTTQLVTVQSSVDAAVPITRLTWSTNHGAEMTVCATSGAPACSFVADGLIPGPNTIEVFAYAADGSRIAQAQTRVVVSVPVREYTLTYLGTLGGADAVGAEVNEKGQVVGWSNDSLGRKHAFAWDGTRMLDVGRELGIESYATGVNDNGELVGRFTSDCKHAFYYKLGQGGNPRLAVEGCGFEAWDINSAGTSLLTLTVERGLHITSDVTGYLLDDLGMHQLISSEPLAELLKLNDKDQVFGQQYGHYIHGRDLALLTTSAPPEPVGYCEGGDLNNLGHFSVLRICEVISNTYNGFVAGKELVSVGYTGANAWGINDRDEAVGMYAVMRRSVPAVMAPFFWDGQRMAVVKYDDVEWTVDSVQDLNNAGVILAHAKNTRTGQQGAVLLTPK